MTTAAPPEKMMPCRCSDDMPVVEPAWTGYQTRCRSCGRHGPIGSNKAFAIAGWNADLEAARRLSAPAAPRVGDDATGLEQWTDAEAIAGLRGDAADIHGRRLHMLANRMRDAAARIERLSAPPAASAEREELALVIHPGAFGSSPSGRGDVVAATFERLRLDAIALADRILAAGYRKRAALPKGQDDE